MSDPVNDPQATRQVLHHYVTLSQRSKRISRPLMKLVIGVRFLRFVQPDHKAETPTCPHVPLMSRRPKFAHTWPNNKTVFQTASKQLASLVLLLLLSGTCRLDESLLLLPLRSSAPSVAPDVQDLLQRDDSAFSPSPGRSVLPCATDGRRQERREWLFVSVVLIKWPLVQAFALPSPYESWETLQRNPVTGSSRDRKRTDGFL